MGLKVIHCNMAYYVVFHVCNSYSYDLTYHRSILTIEWRCVIPTHTRHINRLPEQQNGLLVQNDIQRLKLTLHLINNTIDLLSACISMTLQFTLWSNILITLITYVKKQTRFFSVNASAALPANVYIIYVMSQITMQGRLVLRECRWVTVSSFHTTMSAVVL